MTWCLDGIVQQRQHFVRNLDVTEPRWLELVSDPVGEIEINDEPFSVNDQNEVFAAYTAARPGASCLKKSNTNKDEVILREADFIICARWILEEVDAGDFCGENEQLLHELIDKAVYVYNLIKEKDMTGVPKMFFQNGNLNRRNIITALRDLLLSIQANYRIDILGEQSRNNTFPEVIYEQPGLAGATIT